LPVLAVHFSRTLLKGIYLPVLSLPATWFTAWIDLGLHKWDFFWVQLKWKLLSGVSPSKLQLQVGAQLSPAHKMHTL